MILDIKKVSPIENLIPADKSGAAQKAMPGPSFQEALARVSNPALQGALSAELGKSPSPAGNSDGVKFSNHAVERMLTRGISFNQNDMTRLNDAIGKAAAKGSKDTLILMNESALIVSVKNKTVVTVMDQAALKENVFTNIDSTIVM